MTTLTALVLCAIIAFVLCAALGRPLIGLLRRLAYRQRAYEDAPETHQTKTGTPTMGGVLFLAGPLVAVAFARDAATVALLVLIVGSALIGFIDDYASIRLGRNRGLRGRTKFLFTALVATTFLGLLAGATDVAQRPVFPLGAALPYWAWYALGLAVVLATTHAVNLTDGLDGLASGTIIPPLVVVIIIALRANDGATAVLLAGIAGAVGGFLLYNRHPARMFMGDTGSLALGAALAGGAIVCGAQFVLLVVGGVFAAEALSVIVQVASFKTTRRRVFRMSPLHHHFELGGWPETKVTARFWLASLALSVAGFAWVSR